MNNNKRTTITPGPWHVYYGLCIKASNEHYLIARAIEGMMPKAKRPRAVAEANARLIAAAPDMLEALKLAERYLGRTSAGATIRAAIDKAEGLS